MTEDIESEESRLQVGWKITEIISQIRFYSKIEITDVVPGVNKQINY